MSPAEVSTERILAGRYQVGEVLGHGGRATVYAARDLRLGRDVAIKVWQQSGAEAAAEGRLTARLQRPGVVVVHDAGTDGDVSFLVMERVAGMSLATELRLGPLSAPRAAQIVLQLAQTLALVHADGTVHGDVKPGNVLLGPDDRVTLTDFGVAGPAGTRNPEVALGTPQYLSPEQVRGQAVTSAADVYALGLVLFECLTGTRAFPGGAEVSAVARLRHGPHVPAYVPRDFAALIGEMTASEPARRPTAAQVAARLEPRAPYADTAPLAVAPYADTVPLSVWPAVQPISPRRKPRWALAVAALVAIVLALTLTGTGRHGTPLQPPAPSSTPAPVLNPPSPPAAAVTGSTTPKQHGHGKHRGRG